MSEPIKYTKWLNKVVANVVVDGNKAGLYLGLILIDEGTVAPADSPHRGAIIRKNGTVVRDGWEWMDVIEKNLNVTF